MSYASGVMAGLQRAFLQDFADRLTALDPQFMNEQIGATAALLASGRSGNLNTFASAATLNGTKRDVVVRYVPRPSGAAVTDPSCAVNDKPVFCEETVTLDKYAQVSFKVLDNEIRGLAGTDLALNPVGQAQLMKFVYDRFLQYRNKLYRDIEDINTDELAANIGTNPRTGSTAAETVNVLNSGSTALRADGFVEIRTDLQVAEVPEIRPLVVADVAGLFNTANNFRRFAASNDGGVDFARIAAVLDYEYHISHKLGASLGSDNEFLVIVPGWAQIITAPRYTGTMVKLGDTFSQFTFVDPQTGVPIDVLVQYDPCEDTTGFGETKVRLSVDWSVWTVPSDAFNPSDPLFGFNGVLNYTAAAA
jgi:hypothetical protein